VHVLLRGIDGTAARISRLALVPFVVFYSAWEMLRGTGNGILIDQVSGLPERSGRRAQPWSRISARTA
jgi:hypothetical protein